VSTGFVVRPDVEQYIWQLSFVLGCPLCIFETTLLFVATNESHSDDIILCI